MSMLLRATIDTLAKVLRVRPDQAEDVLRSERSARAAFDRRGLFRAAGAVAAGVAFGDVLKRDRLASFKRLFEAVYTKLAIQQALYGSISADDYIFRAGDFEANGYQPLPPWTPPLWMPVRDITREEAIALYPEPSGSENAELAQRL